jgi:hypothetical protein
MQTKSYIGIGMVGDKLQYQYNPGIRIEFDKDFLYINGYAMPTGTAAIAGSALLCGESGYLYWGTPAAVGATGLQGATGAQGATGTHGNAIRHEIARYLQNERRRNAYTAEVEVDWIEPPNADGPAQLINKIQVAQLLQRLDEIQQMIVILYFYGGFEKREIAVMLGVSNIRVIQLYSAAIDTMRHGHNKKKKVKVTEAWKQRVKKVYENQIYNFIKELALGRDYSGVSLEKIN